MGKKLLTISMLVCGRDTTIRCLDSLVPILEKLDAELILVDTGCDDALREKLYTYTDQIIPFQWCEDFSAARNVGVDAAHGEWFLYIDDDEWFINTEVLIDFFESGQYKKYGCVNYIQRNYYDVDFVHYDDFWASRMIKLDQGTRFYSKIHEYMYPIPGEAYNLPLIANHTGYIFQTPEAKRKHFERNAPLLLEMIEEDPERLRWRVQLMQEYRSIKDYEKMYAFGEECLAYTSNRTQERDCWDIGTFYAGASEAKFFLQDYEESLAIADRGLLDPRMSELCHAYMYLVKGTVYYTLGRWSEAEDCIRKYFKIKKELEKRPIRMANQKSALLVGEAFDIFPLQRCLSILCACELKRKDARKLKKYIMQLGWEKLHVYLCEGFLAVIAEAMATMPLTQDFIDVAQLAWDNPVIQPKFFIEVQSWEERDIEKFHHILHVIAKLNGAQWYLHYAKILVADLDNKPESLKESFHNFLLSTSNVFLTPENITGILKKYDVSMEEEYLAVPFEKWKAHLDEYLDRAEYADILLKQVELSMMRSKENVRYDYFDTRLAELLALYSVREQEFEKKRQALTFFAEKATCYLRKYYQESVILGQMELLPLYGQIAFRLETALGLEDTKPKQALGLYGEIVSVCPEWADVMRSYMHAFGTERERRELAAKEEMEKLQAQVLAEIHKCVKQKQYAQALSILAELKQMKPNDLDVAELSLRVRLAMLQEG